MVDILDLFKIELSYINNENIKNMTIELLRIFRDDFYGIPSAHGGIYHPIDEYAQDGYIRHLKKVAFWVVELCREHKIEGDKADLMLSAVFFHDLGRVDSLKKTYWRCNTSKSHAVRSKLILLKELEKCDFYYNENNKQLINSMMDIIQTHMSHWEESKGAPLPSNLEQIMFATADYCASRRNVTTPFLEQKVELKL